MSILVTLETDSFQSMFNRSSLIHPRILTIANILWHNAHIEMTEHSKLYSEVRTNNSILKCRLNFPTTHLEDFIAMVSLLRQTALHLI